jgi:exodeoxyribonuclease VII small subunit
VASAVNERDGSAKPDAANDRRAVGQGDLAQAPADAIDALSFDVALAQLQQVVGRLEEGGLPLETAISLYERGVALHARCARLLGDAELRVQRLVEQSGGSLAAIDLAPDDGDDEVGSGG